MSWPAVPGATSYKVLVGATPGGTEFGSSTATGLAVDLSDVPTSPRPDLLSPQVRVGAYVCVQAVNATGTSACRSRALVIPDFQDAVDALFFGRGQYRDDSAAPRSSWVAFRPGATVAVTVASTITGGQAVAVQGFVDHLNQVLPGLLRLSVKPLSSEFDTRALAGEYLTFPGEVLVVLYPTQSGFPPQMCDNLAVSGCTKSFALAADPQFLAGGTVALASRDTRVTRHELAHALLGLRHLQLAPPFLDNLAGDSFDGWEVMVMLNGRPEGQLASGFSAFEVEILQAVDTAGLRPGSTRNEFLARGLVR